MKNTDIPVYRIQIDKYNTKKVGLKCQKLLCPHTPVHAVVGKLRRHIRVVESQLGRHVVHVHVVDMPAQIEPLPSPLLSFLLLSREVVSHPLVERPHHFCILVIGEIRSQSSSGTSSVGKSIGQKE